MPRNGIASVLIEDYGFATSVEPFNIGSTAFTSVEPFDIVGPLAFISSVEPFWMYGPSSFTSVEPFDLGSKVSWSSVEPFDLLSAADLIHDPTNLGDGLTEASEAEVLYGFWVPDDDGYENLGTVVTD